MLSLCGSSRFESKMPLPITLPFLDVWPSSPVRPHILPLNHYLYIDSSGFSVGHRCSPSHHSPFIYAICQTQWFKNHLDHTTKQTISAPLFSWWHCRAISALRSHCQTIYGCSDLLQITVWKNKWSCFLWITHQTISALIFIFTSHSNL